jgi:hypothetical protein
MYLEKMMSKFASWWYRNDSNITWFLIGWLTWGMLDNLARGNYAVSLLDAVLVAANYMMWKSRNA